MNTVKAIAPLKSFKCSHCSKVFSAAGERYEYTSTLYGPCTSYRASCPTCAVEAVEYTDPSKVKAAKTHMGGCGSGCACAN